MQPKRWLERICPPCERARQSHGPVPRITPHELCTRLRAGSEVVLLDMRHPLQLLGDPRVLPGAMRLRPQDLAHGALPFEPGAEVVLYSGAKGDEASEFAARRLIRRGFGSVRVLAGGLPAWDRAGLPLASYDVREDDRKGRSRAACRESSSVFR